MRKLIGTLVITTAMLCLLCSGLRAQNGLTALLDSVAKYNGHLAVYGEQRNAMRLYSRTGIFLPNPEVGLDFMVGSPATAGDQIDLTVNQRFDFPTAYAAKKDLGQAMYSAAELEYNQARQEVLTQALDAYLHGVHARKVQTMLEKRAEKLLKLAADYQRKLDAGNGNQLDVNKARLQWLAVDGQLREAQAELEYWQQEIKKLNGDHAFAAMDTSYPNWPVLPAFEVLEAEVESADPARRYLLGQKSVAEREMELAKAMRMPQLELGYHYQAILGQRFQGVHIGTSIPLWENKNRVTAKEADLKVAETRVDAHLTEHYFDLAQSYDKMTRLKAQMEAYKAVFDKDNSLDLLDKALQLGQISTVVYFQEQDFFYNAQLEYLALELAYQKRMVMLTRHRL